MRIQFGILMILLGACMAAAAEISTDTSASSANVLDEVVVTGTRLRELRAAAIKAEERVVTRYNELNQDEDLDIDCLKYTPTGTRLSYRYCLTKLQEHAQQEDASHFMTYMRNSDVQNGAAAPIRETGVRLMERSEDYRRNLVKLLQENPDLRELVSQSADAFQSYEAARLKRLKSKNLPDE